MTVAQTKVKNPMRIGKRCVTVWLTPEDYATFTKLAKQNERSFAGELRHLIRTRLGEVRA